MILKISRALWFFSFITLFAYLLYGYAGWPQDMVIQERGGDRISTSKDTLFYGLLALYLLINVQPYLVKRIYPQDEDLRSWFHGLMVCVNIFFIISMNILGVYNSLEVFDFGRVAFMVYGSILLIGSWTVAWPLFLLYKKFFIKQSI